MLDDPLLNKQNTRPSEDEFSSSEESEIEEGQLKVTEEILDAALEKGATEHAVLLKLIKTQVQIKLD